MKKIAILINLFIGFLGVCNTFGMNMPGGKELDVLSKEEMEILRTDPEANALYKSILREQKQINRINRKLRKIERLEKEEHLSQALELANNTIAKIERKPKHKDFLTGKTISVASNQFDKMLETAPQQPKQKIRYQKKQPIPVSEALKKILTSKLPELAAVDFAKSHRIVDVNAKLQSREGTQTLLHKILCSHSANQKELINAIKILLIWGADINATDYLGNTALHYAVLAGNLEAIQLLGQVGANVNMKNERGNTPLLEFYYNKAGLREDVRKKGDNALLNLYMENQWLNGNNLECIKELLLLGADIAIENNAGESIVTYLKILKDYNEQNKKKNQSYWETLSSYFDYTKYDASYFMQPMENFSSEMHKLVSKFSVYGRSNQKDQVRGSLFGNPGIYTSSQLALFVKEYDFIRKIK